MNKSEYDVIIVGSGTSGATLAKELADKNVKILLLEKGVTRPLKESIRGLASVIRDVEVSGKVKAARAITTGGTTGVYFGVVKYPPLDKFRSFGIDLETELESAKSELPIAPLSDELISPQNKIIEKSALDLGFSWQKNAMLIDQGLCLNGYSYEARWKARTFVDEAINNGVQLKTQTSVHRVLVDNGRAMGVECEVKKGLFSTERINFYGQKIILCAGALETPMILSNSGVDHIADRGFYCDPGFALFGLVPDLQGDQSYVGCMSCNISDNVELGDANLAKTFHRLLMLSCAKFRHFFSYHKTVGVGVKVNDEMSGEMMPNGRLYKNFTESDLQYLKQGEDSAIKILKNSGATHIFNSGLTSAGHVGGMVRLQEHVDHHLETQFKNLYVCDGSLLPESIRITPTVTLVCLAKYLAKHIQSA